MEELFFTEYLLIINDNNIPQIDIFKDVKNDIYEFNNTSYKIDCEIINNKFFWVYAEKGKAMPYSKEILNTDTKEFNKNPRNPNEVELRHQTFCLYYPDESVLYISNAKSNSFLSDYFKEKFNQEFNIKKCIISPEDFVKEIKSINNIKFTSMEPNLFNGDIFGEINDVLGYGINVNYFNLEVKLTNGKFNPTEVLDFLKIWKQRKENQQIKKMICVGKDDDGMEKIFNLNTFSKKINISAIKDENEMYNPESIKKSILEKLNV